MRKLYFILSIVITVLIFGCEKQTNKIPQLTISTETIQIGGTFQSSLIEEGLELNEIYELQQAIQKLFDLRKCRVGDKYEIAKSNSGEIKEFRYYHERDIYRLIRTENGKFSATVEKTPLTETVMGISGKIKSSLWEALSSQGLSAELIMNFADLFAWQIDFFTETRPMDSYKLIWIRYIDNNGKTYDGKILAAQYQGKETGSYSAVRFNNDYYDLKGKSIKKYFLRAPLNYRRISSYFTHKRFHPILKYYRPHLGIDYSAPTGTPIVSVADGTVTYKGWKGENGNLVIVRHNSTYTSSYGHLSGFAKRIKTGIRVKQGQVIGYVGATGLATGPHLDFRMRKNGAFINFLKLKFPAANEVKKEQKEEFTKFKKELLTNLAATSYTKGISGINLTLK